MNTVIKIVFASALALSGAVPAFAGHASKMSHRADHSQVERVRTDAATDANAYAPIGAPSDPGPDFGIGSQS